VHGWRRAVGAFGASKETGALLKSDVALDVFKFGCTLSDRGGRPPWLLKELACKQGTAKEVRPDYIAPPPLTEGCMEARSGMRAGRANSASWQDAERNDF
jgi:hypothetical protein